MIVDGEGAGRRAVPFKALDPGVRKAVRVAAARGELHPDPMVAASSIDWAHSRLTAKVGLRAATGGLAVGAVLNLIDFPDLPNGEGFLRFWRERRLGKRIAKAAERSGFQAPRWALIDGASGPKIPVADLVTKAGFGVEVSDGRRQRRHGKPSLRRP